jgi:tetratricopeptide (TPR) repeat protein
MPQSLFRLTVDDLTARGRFDLRLTDGKGQFLASHEVRADPSDARWRGLFEMDKYLEVQRGRGLTDPELLAELGDFLRTDVLGPRIAAHLFKSRRPGTLFVELPRERRPEVIELTRIPWELARDERGRTLPDMGLAVQVLPRGVMPEGLSLDRALAAARPFDPDGPLRVLLAFAQSRGQATLAMRDMRERLRLFFLKDLAPKYQVEVEVLQYGVTRRALERAARRGGGYHVVHLFAHGHVHLFAHGHEDLLVLEDEEGRDDYVSGEEIADLLSGGFATPPYLVFLTACHSGEVQLQREIADLWQALRRVQDQMAGTGAAQDFRSLGDFGSLADYTGTAFAMLRAEVPQVVAMRYSVEERFAFDLAETFYRHVLMDGTPPALALGRFRAEARREGARRGYRPHDWATPAFFGGAQGTQPIRLRRGRSEAADRLWVRGHLPDELRRVELFVGRADELRDLRRRVFGEEADQSVSLLWGVGGLGKTALAAEAIHLWHADFDFTLGARPPAAGQPLSLDGWLQEVNYHVMTSLRERGYRIWDEQGDLARDRWLESRLDELVRFLNRHRMLLVIDNFEPNLRREGEGGRVRYVCADPDWGRTLTRLAADLAPGLSCLLVTSRRAPDELSRLNVLSIPVGPLDQGEWWVFARVADNFRRLILGSDENRRLLARALSVARGHPLILKALEQLAADPAELARRLDEFEARGERYAGMGDLLTTARTAEERAQEMAYFEDIAAHSVRALIEDRSPAAQRLLRVVTLALEPVHDGLIAAIWEDRYWSRAKEMWEDMLGPEEAPPLEAVFPDELIAAICEMPLLQPEGQGWQEPLGELLDAGLLTPKHGMSLGIAGETEEVVAYVWHPIVAEQSAEVLPAGEGFPEVDYLQRYAFLRRAIFRRLLQAHNQAEAQMAIQSARLAVRYLLRLGDTGTATTLIGDIYNLSRTLSFRRELRRWIRQLLQQVPSEREREMLLVVLADICKDEGRSHAAIPLYRQALVSAEAREDWHACGTISHQLGLALRDATEYAAAHDAYRAALRYKRRAGKTTPGRLHSLGELVRLMVFTGDQARARPHAARLVRIARTYYERCTADPASAERWAAGEPVGLLISILDILRQIEARAGNWQAALLICEQNIELKTRHHKEALELALSRGQRATCLIRLDRLDDAERDLLFCLRVFREHQQPLNEAKTLSQLADLANERGDAARAAQFEAQALEIYYRLDALRTAAISHWHLGIYYAGLEQIARSLVECFCASLIYTAIGQQGPLNNLRSALSHIPPAERRAHWPTAADLFAAHPRLGELLAARGVDQAQAQQMLDRLWGMVAGT